jgi:hypothetical protein
VKFLAVARRLSARWHPRRGFFVPRLLLARIRWIEHCRNPLEPLRNEAVRVLRLIMKKPAEELIHDSVQLVTFQVRLDTGFPCMGS